MEREEGETHKGVSLVCVEVGDAKDGDKPGDDCHDDDPDDHAHAPA